jgi:nitrogen fixation/metabolism regulation signal transduction histidine kinase
MAFNRVHFHLLLLVILLVASSVVLGWFISASLIHFSVIVGLMVLAEAILLFRMLTRTNREILFFFRALENDDTTIRYTGDHSGRLIDELHHLLDNLNMNFQQIRMNNEISEQYFSRILENLSSGLIVVSHTGHVNKVNTEALRLLGIPRLKHIKNLQEKHPELYRTLEQMTLPGKSEVILKKHEGVPRRIAGIQATAINLKGEEVRIITLQDLSLELERKEIDGWIRLIRVMSHEIMNSLAPITSISTTLREVWAGANEEGNEPGDPRIRQTVKGLDAIAEQSEGLTAFFESYRVLSRIPDPVLQEFPVCEMLEKLKTLMIHDPGNKGIRMDFECGDKGLSLYADEQMVTNVLVNLIKNGVHALESVENPRILVSAEGSEEHIIFRVRDNGTGIPPSIAEEIFMPFFTTRSGGSGVGLSYSRQVMNMLGGVIGFESEPGRTEFRLVFPR